MSDSMRNSLCRLCAKSHKSLTRITRETVNKIALIFEVPIGNPKNDPLPTNICKCCIYNVNQVWDFFTEIHSAQKLLTVFFKSEANVETIVISPGETFINESESISKQSDLNNELEEISDDDEIMKLYDGTEKSNTSEVYEENLIELEDVVPSENVETESQNNMIQNIEECADSLYVTENVEPYFAYENYNLKFGTKISEEQYSEVIDVLIENTAHKHALESENHIDTTNVNQTACKNKLTVRKRAKPTEKEVQIKKVYPCICYICDRGFNEGTKLQSHMQTHKLKKPFKCYLCSSQFDDLSNWHNHLRIVHGVVFEMAAKLRKTFEKTQLASDVDIESQLPANFIKINMS